ncbi:MAG TPA: DUF1801 domain-containing protein [Rhizomicrobium sp.]
MRGIPPAKSVDAYIKAAPQSVRAKLVQLRQIVKSLAPDADEGISYGMPYYKWNGALVGFAAFKKHIGFFPGAIVSDFKRELAGYETAKGTVRFPLEEPLPVMLIRKLIRASLKRNEMKAPKRTV